MPRLKNLKRSVPEVRKVESSLPSSIRSCCHIPKLGDENIRQKYKSVYRKVQKEYIQDIEFYQNVLSNFMRIPRSAFKPSSSEEGATNEKNDESLNYEPKTFTEEYCRNHKSSKIEFQHRLKAIVDRTHKVKSKQLLQEVEEKEKSLMYYCYVATVPPLIGALGWYFW
ncbi:uncharacterized protein LOC119684049 [Teleopsis dalmanni]|uniref:uncharacterized protein LOC119684049 n=1 Tax=Teleopsis dalmanni TaxID=139649 RepID=UPI0018CFAFF0|nr:uncharacterized protein LOC119684049 [Teleopsis dalmanni]